MSSPIRSALLALAFAPAALFAQGPLAPATLTVDAAHPGAQIAPTMFGIFFEDINFGADGGLYPELIKNRSFEFTESLTGWKAHYNIQPPEGMGAPQGEISVHTESPLNASNPHYLRLTAYKAGYGLANSGFRGIGVEAGKEYRFSAWMRTRGPKAIRATLNLGSMGMGKAIGTASLSGFTGEWQRYETILKATETTANAEFNLYLDEPGTVELDMVSLFPVDTYKGRSNGLRKDLVEKLAAMHPGFIRFPGGCIVEGRQLANRYRWKRTVGKLEERVTQINRWNNEFDQKPAPDYFQSYGLGFYEYFLLAEDLGAAPLPILNCGMACEFNSGETARLDQLDEYIQDALDLIEFANGDAATPWGKLRAQMGHPEPFHLTMIGVGNEQWGPTYLERYKPFAAALKAHHPEIQLVVSAGPAPGGQVFDELWSNWRSAKADIVDEHYYMNPDWFLKNTTRYDTYDRSGPKVFAGEYAAQTGGQAQPDNRNTWGGAIAEAAFMTGLERNADVVRMAIYAPLLANVNAWQWTPDLIWFDNLRSYGTPNYEVQKLFSTNVGTRVVPVTPAAADGLYAVASIDERTHELIVTSVNYAAQSRATTIALEGAKVGAEARTITLAGADLRAENDFDHPANVAAVNSIVAVSGSGLKVELKPYSVTVYRFALK